MTTVIIIFVIALIVEIKLKPRLDFARGNKILLWYGKQNRKYLVLF